jgi:tetratricopeptide (TPR) repeat protein
MESTIEKVQALMKARQYNEALALLAELDEPQAWHLRAISYLQLSDFDKAGNCLEKALERFPNHPELLSERGVLYIHLRKYSLALLDMDMAANLDPKNPYRYSSRAYLKERMGDLEGAMQDYERALTLDPDDAVSYNNLGLLLEKAGRQSAAMRSFLKADALNNSMPLPGAPGFAPAKETESDEMENEPEVKGGVLQTMLTTLSNQKLRKEFFRWLLGKR